MCSIDNCQIMMFFIESVNGLMTSSTNVRSTMTTRTLLQLNSSLNSTAGQSSRLADAFVARWRAANPGSTVIARDLATDPVPHLTAERFGAFLAKPEERSAEQQSVVAYSDALIDELRRADVI